LNLNSNISNSSSNNNNTHDTEENLRLRSSNSNNTYEQLFNKTINSNGFAPGEFVDMGIEMGFEPRPRTEAQMEAFRRGQGSRSLEGSVDYVPRVQVNPRPPLALKTSKTTSPATPFSSHDEYCKVLNAGVSSGSGLQLWLDADKRKARVWGARAKSREGRFRSGTSLLSPNVTTATGSPSPTRQQMQASHLKTSKSAGSKMQMLP